MLGSDQLYREWGYVALSRARDRTDVYLVGDSPADAERTIVEGLRDSRAQQLAGSGEVVEGFEAAERAWEEAQAASASAQQRLGAIARERDELSPWQRLRGAERRLDDESGDLRRLVKVADQQIRSIEAAARDRVRRQSRIADMQSARDALHRAFPERQVTRNRDRDTGRSL